MRLFSDRGKRTKWEAGLIWFRLRYLDPPIRAINLLSRPEACDRVALYYRPGEPVSRLFIGIPQTHTRLLERMAAEFGFSVAPKPPEVTIPPSQPMKAVADLPWDSTFMAHIANEFAFVSLENEGGRGPYLPQPPFAEVGRGAARWTLPVNPPPGLTLNPSWNDHPWDGHQPALPLTGNGRDARHWPLGRTATGVPLGVCGRINLYGRQEAVAGWLVEQVAQMVTHEYANLVVIDGAGDLVPRLKRKAAVTRLLGKELSYVDIDGPALAGGFNPLAVAPGETEAVVVRRWQQWFEGMNVHPESIQLLAQARRNGVGDIPALGQWLKRAERQGQQTVTSASSATLSRAAQAVSSLSMALNRLTADRGLREWLEWPDNPFEILPEGALFFSCKNRGWSRRQLLRMALIGAMQVEGVRLVVHGFPWETVDLTYQKQIVVSNGPRLPGGTVVLTECHAQGAAVLAGRFLNGNLELQEHLELLQRNACLIVMEEGVIAARLTDAGEGRSSRTGHRGVNAG